MNDFTWVGSERNFVNEPDVLWVNRIVVGRFGGNSSAGQTKNEDACIVWQHEDWEFTAILDAHKSAESAELVIRTLQQHKGDLIGILLMEGFPKFKQLEEKLLGIFQSADFMKECRNVKGETACLIVVRKSELHLVVFHWRLLSVFIPSRLNGYESIST